jgi:hypothetical protein
MDPVSKGLCPLSVVVDLPMEARVMLRSTSYRGGNRLEEESG